ncbi:MAG: hypothetical protein ACRD5J_16395 [Nitrososphaeraceae archaeon]
MVVCITFSFTLNISSYGRSSIHVWHCGVCAFAVLTRILFSFRTKRKSEERKSTTPASTSGGERKGAI